MTATTAYKNAVSAMLIDRWEQTGSKLLSLAQGFPGESYETAPVNSVRTFGGVLRHVAFWNNYLADKLRGLEADDSANELPQAKYGTKQQVLTALAKSTEDAAIALRARADGLDSEAAALVESFIEHICEHYGQLVVYSRWAGIAPPASQS
ncbi:MAG TPA: DinB family protein [Bryobacteraceae bacterium]|nr:DinB family protein [Bryobacteraceae bacterium]